MNFFSAVLLLVISVGLAIYAGIADDALLFAIGSISGVISISELWDMCKSGECE